MADARVDATGCVLAEGIGGPGLSTIEGRMMLAEAKPAGSDARAAFSGYGRNMAVRVACPRQNDLRFDERLPLYAWQEGMPGRRVCLAGGYGWQEDVGLSRRLAAFGRVVQPEAARGVHLGVKRGRGSGVRLGCSQVADPLYLAGKRCSYRFGRALPHVARNMAMNIVRAGWPEPYVDRRGRLRGNIFALRDLLHGRMMPERVLEL